LCGAPRSRRSEISGAAVTALAAAVAPARGPRGGPRRGAGRRGRSRCRRRGWRGRRPGSGRPGSGGPRRGGFRRGGFRRDGLGSGGLAWRGPALGLPGGRFPRCALLRGNFLLFPRRRGLFAPFGLLGLRLCFLRHDRPPDRFGPGAHGDQQRRYTGNWYVSRTPGQLKDSLTYRSTGSSSAPPALGPRSPSRSARLDGPPGWPCPPRFA